MVKTTHKTRLVRGNRLFSLREKATTTDKPEKLRERVKELILETERRLSRLKESEDELQTLRDEYGFILYLCNKKSER